VAETTYVGASTCAGCHAPEAERWRGSHHDRAMEEATEQTVLEVAYTFGVDPLQQYLIAFPDGRYQALGIVWDSRPREQGGQRWFHLYPAPKPGDPLHWTGIDQTWNHMCAECHAVETTPVNRRSASSSGPDRRL
jgi:cytochrome c554/c'-like protein